jgi:hypothetical protein
MASSLRLRLEWERMMTWRNFHEDVHDEGISWKSNEMDQEFLQYPLLPGYLRVFQGPGKGLASIGFLGKAACDIFLAGHRLPEGYHIVCRR